MSLTLPKSFFFAKADFESMFKNGKKKFGSFFVVYFRPLESEHTKRLGFTVSKKSTKINVKRNLVKRIVRETYRLKQHELAQYQILVVGKRDLKAADRIKLREDLCRLFESL